MPRSVSAWHIAIAIPLALAGCYAADGREPLGDAARADAGRDAAIVATDGPPIETPCSQIIRRIRDGEEPAAIGCGRGLAPVDCALPVGECCVAAIECAIEPTDGGHVVVSLSCDDSCDQGCAAQAEGDCAFFPYCEWFDEGACGGEPGTILGPACAPRRMGECETEADCAAGLQCRAYQVNPCLGLPCDACGARQTFCAP
jgi:hypothetical protein